MANKNNDTPGQLSSSVKS